MMASNNSVTAHPLPASPIKGEVGARWVGQERATATIDTLPPVGRDGEGVLPPRSARA